MRRLDPKNKDEGPSPRVRGSHARLRKRLPHLGSIPACAGKPRSCDGRQLGVPSRVHPRVCGEAPDSDPAGFHQGSPSPRVRGSHAGPEVAVGDERSIPACPAGSRRRRCDPPLAIRVHPRVCGEAGLISVAKDSRSGVHPRVCGEARTASVRRRIMACAWVHPRVCGEAVPRARARQPRPWVHPRVCGEATRPGTDDDGVRGSIPACAGKPSPGRPSGPSGEGPSPRVRGSRVLAAS